MTRSHRLLGDLHAVPQPPLADVPCPLLELTELQGRTVLCPNLLQEPRDPPEVAPEPVLAQVDVRVPAVQVEVDAVVAVIGEQPDLVHPGPHLLVVLAAGGRRPGQVHQEAVHALHLLPDELDVTADTAQQPPFIADDAKQRGHSARRELSHIASSPAVGNPPRAT